MTQRLDIHQPTTLNDLSEEGKRISAQAVYDLLIAQSNIIILFDEIADKLHLDSFLIQDISLLTGQTNLVEHKLGRKIIGWYVVDTNNVSDVFRDFDSTADLTKHLPLKCSANTTISIVVF